MLRNLRWFAVLGAAALAVSVVFGTALADPGDSTGDGVWGPGMHGQMNQEAYGEMIRHMTEVHGAEFTGEMLQRMNEEGDCHNHGHGDEHGWMGTRMMHSGTMNVGMMNGRFGGGRMFDGVMRSAQEMMPGMFEGDGLPNRGFTHGDLMGR